MQVAAAVSKGGEVTESVLARRYSDAFLAIEGLALGDVCARDSLVAGLACTRTHDPRTRHSAHTLMLNVYVRARVFCVCLCVCLSVYLSVSLSLSLSVYVCVRARA